MSIKLHTAILLMLSISFAHAPAALASVDSSQQPAPDVDRQWNQLQNTSPGVELIVESTGKSSVRGRFVRASDTKLVIYVDQKDFEIDRSSIRRIYAVKERSRSKATRTGAAVGLLAGIGTGLLVVVGGRNSDSNLAPVGMGVIGMVAGAAIGALSGGKHRGQLLYSSK